MTNTENFLVSFLGCYSHLHIVSNVSEEMIFYRRGEEEER